MQQKRCCSALSWCCVRASRIGGGHPGTSAFLIALITERGGRAAGRVWCILAGGGELHGQEGRSLGGMESGVTRMRVPTVLTSIHVILKSGKELPVLLVACLVAGLSLTLARLGRVSCNASVAPLSPPPLVLNGHGQPCSLGRKLRVVPSECCGQFNVAKKSALS